MVFLMFIMESPMKMDDLGVTPFKRKPPFPKKLMIEYAIKFNQNKCGLVGKNHAISQD
jgi:hypothetical protein